MLASNLTDSVENEIASISYKGKVIAREARCSKKLLDSLTQAHWNRIHRLWEPAFHGTKYKYIEPIMKHGLLPSGSKNPDGHMIKPPKNHYQLGENHFGVDNWANAMFVSPSILYASHACYYSERILAGGSQWCVVIKVFVKPSSYKAYNPVFSALNRDFRPVYIWMIFPVNQCVVVNFTDINGVRMPIWRNNQGNEFVWS
jgi:hypothetical protein